MCVKCQMGEAVDHGRRERGSNLKGQILDVLRRSSFPRTPEDVAIELYGFEVHTVSKVKAYKPCDLCRREYNRQKKEGERRLVVSLRCRFCREVNRGKVRERYEASQGAYSYKVCKDANGRKMVATLLGQMFRAGVVSRENGRYRAVELTEVGRGGC